MKSQILNKNIELNKFFVTDCVPIIARILGCAQALKHIYIYIYI